MSGPEKTRSAGATRKAKPQLISDKTAVESVMDFFQGISQAYGTSSNESKERIVWARIVAIDKESTNNCSPFDSSLLLILGYVNGVQIWKMMGNGDAEEVFSVREGAVKAVCVLSPAFNADIADPYLESRPLIAMATTVVNSTDNVFSAVSIRSLRTGAKVKTLEWTDELTDMFQTDRYLVVTVLGSIHVLDVFTFDAIFTVTGCFHGLGLNANPIAFGTRWLAYSPESSLTELHSLGGLATSDDQSYTETVVSAAQTITSATTRGLQMLTGGVNWLASKSISSSSPGSSPNNYYHEYHHHDNYHRPRNGSVSSNHDNSSSSSSSLDHRRSSRGKDSADNSSADSHVAGLVTILDVNRIVSQAKNITEKLKPLEVVASHDNVVAHFAAHANFAIAFMTFSPCGRLLATSDTRGHSFNVYSIFAYPRDSTRTAVHHLYALWRGDTFSKVQELQFSWDCRWLSASTLRGTCHIFPITPYGGRPTVRTHTSKRMVSRLSTYCKSAGIDEIEYMESLQSNLSKLTTQDITNVSRALGWQDSRHRMLASRAAHYNPRLMPFLPPTQLKALTHVRVASSSVITNTLPGMLSGQASFTVPTNDQPSANANKSVTKDGDVVMATYFVPNPWVDRRSGASSAAAKQDTIGGGLQRLLVLSSNGFLTEYSIQPRCHHSLQVAKEDSPIEADTCSTVCWNLHRSATWSYLPFDLPASNPLIEAANNIKAHYDNISTTPEHRRVLQDDDNKSGEVVGDNKVKTEQPRSSVSKQIAKFSKCDDQSKTTSAEGVRVRVHPEWQSQVENDTHDGPTRRLWMGPQFTFVPLGTPAATKPLSSDSSSVLTHGRHDADGYMSRDFSVDGAADYAECDIQRSAPIPMQKNGVSGDRDDYIGNDYTIKVGSGTFDRVSTMLNMGGDTISSNGRCQVMVSHDGQNELQKRIAEAINETDGCNKKHTTMDNLNDQPEELLFTPDLSFPSKSLSVEPTSQYVNFDYTSDKLNDQQLPCDVDHFSQS